MPDLHPYIVLATLIGSLVLFLTDAIRYEVVALLVVAVLAGSGCLTGREAFEGFASPAVVLIVSMYVFGHAFTQWGVAEMIGQRFLRAEEGQEGRLVFRVVLVSGLLSAVLSNTGVVATMIPVCSGLARTYRIPVSRLLMPMSFGTAMGGLLTVIATSKNIAVNEIIEAEGLKPFGLFDFSLFGLILLGLASLYFLGPGRSLLPRSPVDQSLSDRYQVRKFVTEALIEPSSTLINRSVADADLFGAYGITVLGIVRAGGEATVLAPGPYNRIRPGDTLILQGEPSAIVRMRDELDLREKEWVDAGDTRLYSDDVSLVEAVIPAGSPIAGQTIKGYGFRTRTGLNVLAISRQGELQGQSMLDVPLQVGDTLLVQGHRADIERQVHATRLIMLDEVKAPRRGKGAKISAGLLALILLLGAFTSIELSVLACCGAVALLLLGVVRADELPSIVNWPVLFLIGGMLALGKAFGLYEWDERVAEWLTLAGDGLSPRTLLLFVSVATALMTQVLNYISTAIIMTPVAIQLATQLGVDPRPFLMAVIACSEFSFMSPIAHQSNAMVMGPGGYRYRDFLRAGTILTVLMVLASWLLIPVFWPLVQL